MTPFNRHKHPPLRPITIHDLTTAHDPRHEFALLSLLEMSRELAFSLDLFETVDLLLFNLMGQFGCARSAFWVLGGEDESGPILLKSHGFPPGSARRIGGTCSDVVRRYLEEVRSPILTAWLTHTLDREQMDDLHQGQYAMFAPLIARGRLLGWIALGSRLDASNYDTRDIQMLEAALGMVSSSLESALLMMSLQEHNRQLRSSNERLTELDRLKSEFLSNANHELRTPVAVVVAALESLETVIDEQHAARHLLDAARSRARGLHGILETLLTFSDASHSQLTDSLRMCDIVEFTDAFVAARRPGLTANLRALEYTCSPALPPVMCDTTRVEQVLNQLVDNALKFTPQGSGITIGVTAAIDDGAPWVRISVRDSGPGIDVDAALHLFESFRQGDGSSRRTVGGLGLGLALSRQLLERMNGRLELANPGEPGACFALWLPVVHQTKPAAETQQ